MTNANGLKTTHYHHIPLSSDITHSIYFHNSSEGVRGLLRAKICTTNQESARLSSVRSYQLTEPNDSINFNELEDYCNDINISANAVLSIPRIESHSHAEQLSESIAQLLYERDLCADAGQFNPMNPNLEPILSQLKSLTVSGTQIVAKRNLISALEALQQSARQDLLPTSDPSSNELIENIETAREKLLKLPSKNETEQEALEAFDAALCRLFIKTSWCLAIEKQEGIQWFPE